RRWTDKRRIVGEISGEPFVDLGDPSVYGGKVGHVGSLGLAIAFVGACATAAFRSPSRCCHAVTRSWRSRTSATRPGSPLTPRAAICCHDWAACDLCAHCAATLLHRRVRADGGVDFWIL